ncbi:MAG TPA: short-chain dehydrogenase [Deltaproteobacteria bacterium]|nr:short-chain dehydrogenase [Deltaproteobacteria bacterium]
MKRTQSAQKKFTGKTVMVTGASSGIGLEISRRFAALGAKIILVGRDEKKLLRAARTLNSTSAFPYRCDVRDVSALRKLVQDVTKKHGDIDILINNAGFNKRGAFLSVDLASLESILQTNLVAPIVLSRLCAEHMPRGGAVINIASIAGMVPVYHEAAYSASKAGLRAFGRVIAEELAPRGIRVKNINPGPVDTGFLGHEVESVPDLVFSQPMSSAAAVAELVVQAIPTQAVELAIPRSSALLATLAYVFPAFLRITRPVLEKIGRYRKQRYLLQRRTGKRVTS